MATYVGTDVNNFANTSKFAHAVGLEGNDYLITQSANSTLEGNEGHDFLYFRFPASGSIYGGSGNDAIIDAADGASQLYGGEGNDYIQYEGNHSSTLYGGGGTDLIDGSSRSDDLIHGGEGDDKGSFSAANHSTVSTNVLVTYTGGLFGSYGDDQIYGESDDDEIYGGAGNDYMEGGPGDDRIDGGGGKDIIIGGYGSERGLRGGAGPDKFVFNDIHETSSDGSRADVIHDFDHNEGDFIRLADIDARRGGADDPFDYIGADPFSGAAGELRFANGELSGDVDGDRHRDFLIKFRGLDEMVRGDFVL